jgi:hypothetical protein
MEDSTVDFSERTEKSSKVGSAQATDYLSNHCTAEAAAKSHELCSVVNAAGIADPTASDPATMIHRKAVEDEAANAAKDGAGTTTAGNDGGRNPGEASGDKADL